MRIPAIMLAFTLSVTAYAVQNTPEAHVAAAKAAAGQEYTSLFTTLCPAAPAAPAANTAAAPQRGQRGQAGARGDGAAAVAPAPARGQRRGPPDVATWHAEPVKVFDNLY